MSNDITAETIQKILEISTPILQDVTDAKGRPAPFAVHSGGFKEVQAAPPALAPSVSVNTLAGFADLVRAKLEEKDFPKDFLIHIEDFQTITLIQRVSDEYGRRPTLIKATPVPFEPFKFGQWLDQEAFAINLAARFAGSTDLAYVLNMAGSLTNDASTNSEDDGFSQRVNIKAGLRMKEQTTIKPRVDLAPYRTFPEVAQPVSPFVFRARTMGEAPSLMLVEADGGAWKVQAIATLKAAMEAFDLGVPIIA